MVTDRESHCSTMTRDHCIAVDVDRGILTGQPAVLTFWFYRVKLCDVARP
jgi:hypothetical protein